MWAFTRAFDVPYCALYDQGYTSLGSKNTTKPNPKLRREDGSYAPAYELSDCSAERLGRNSNASSSA